MALPCSESDVPTFLQHFGNYVARLQAQARVRQAEQDAIVLPLTEEVDRLQHMVDSLQHRLRESAAREHVQAQRLAHHSVQLDEASKLREAAARAHEEEHQAASTELRELREGRAQDAQRLAQAEQRSRELSSQGHGAQQLVQQLQQELAAVHKDCAKAQQQLDLERHKKVAAVQECAALKQQLNLERQEKEAAVQEKSKYKKQVRDIAQEYRLMKNAYSRLRKEKGSNSGRGQGSVQSADRQAAGSGKLPSDPEGLADAWQCTSSDGELDQQADVQVADVQAGFGNPPPTLQQTGSTHLSQSHQRGASGASRPQDWTDARHPSPSPQLPVQEGPNGAHEPAAMQRGAPQAGAQEQQRMCTQPLQPVAMQLDAWPQAHAPQAGVQEEQRMCAQPMQALADCAGSDDAPCVPLEETATIRAAMPNAQPADAESAAAPCPPAMDALCAPAMEKTDTTRAALPNPPPAGTLLMIPPPPRLNHPPGAAAANGPLHSVGQHQLHPSQQPPWQHCPSNAATCAADDTQPDTFQELHQLTRTPAPQHKGQKRPAPMPQPPAEPAAKQLGFDIAAAPAWGPEDGSAAAAVPLPTGGPAWKKAARPGGAEHRGFHVTEEAPLTDWRSGQQLPAALSGEASAAVKRQDGSTAAADRSSSVAKEQAGGEYKYQDVVRKRSEREKLKGGECLQCQRFYEALQTWGTIMPGQLPGCGHVSDVLRIIDERGLAIAGGDLPPAGGGLVSREELREAGSRHRYRYQPPATPNEFWNMDFTAP